LYEIFGAARAKYKLYFKGKFICFSPEKFIEIRNDTISTYPMKGTIDATLPNPKETILNNPKELAEHIMITDLMRNDIGMVANGIRVDEFRYVESIKAGEQELLQVSSKISGKLDTNWQSKIGDILEQVTPAGSITGTPKRKTTQILSLVEDYDRGFYTGVFGIVDGDTLISSVMIRFMEENDGELYYKSGGGITLDSDCESEYEELNRKIYLPF
jgi:para-aminobenzoate synthetase component 1